MSTTVVEKIDLQLSETSITSIREQESTQEVSKTIRNFLTLYWRYVFALLWPLLLSLLFIYSTSVKIRTLYVLLIVYAFWTFDIFSEGVIALIPIFALPCLQILHIHTTCTIFFQYGFFVVTAVLMAICLDHSGVHERVTLYIMWKLGGSPRAIQFVISTICFLMSVRIANTYSVVLMLPIINKILYEMNVGLLHEKRSKLKFSAISLHRIGVVERPINLSLAFYCGTIYASDLGGMNFVIGSLTNFAFTTSYQRRYPNCGIPQSPWFFYTMPVGLIAHFGCVLWVQILYLGICRSGTVSDEYRLLSNLFKEQKIIENLYFRLGKIRFSEICVAIAYLVYVTLWYVDNMLYFKHKKEYYLLLFITDSMPFFIITFGLLLVPNNLDYLKNVKLFCSKDLSTKDKKKSYFKSNPGVMSWRVVQEKVPWERVFVLGAMVAMAQAEFSTGLAKDMASYLSFMKDLNYCLLLFIVTLFANIMTETCSNGIICGVFAPLVIEFSILCKIHPVHIGLPYALVCSFGMVTKYASLNIKKIINAVSLSPKSIFVTGIFPKIYCWLLIFGTYQVYGEYILHGNAIFPKNFLDTNVTCYCPPCPFHSTSSKPWRMNW